MTVLFTVNFLPILFAIMDVLNIDEDVSRTVYVYVNVCLMHPMRSGLS